MHLIARTSAATGASTINFTPNHLLWICRWTKLLECWSLITDYVFTGNPEPVFISLHLWCTLYYCTHQIFLPRFPTWLRLADNTMIPKNMTVSLLYPQIQGPSKAFIYTGSADHVKAAKRQVWYFTNEVIAVTHENVVPHFWLKVLWSILYMAVFGIIINLMNTN